MELLRAPHIYAYLSIYLYKNIGYLRMRKLMRTHVYYMQLMCVGFGMHVIVCVRVCFNALHYCLYEKLNIVVMICITSKCY